MKAIITGATGGLGRNLGEFLLDKGWNILGFGRNKEIGAQLPHSFKSFDLSEKKDCLENFEYADVVFHCAAFSSPWGKYEDFYRSNVIATRNVIVAMKKYKIPKIVFVSTPSIYFEFKDHLNIKESYLAKNFGSHYTKTKYLSELELLKSDIFYAIIRPRGIFGKYDTVLMPRVKEIASKGFFPIIKNKNIVIDITYVKNVAYAMFLMATKDIDNCTVFNITNDESLDIKDIFKLVSNVIEKDVPFKEVSYKKLMFFARILEILARLKIIKEPVLTKYTAGLMANSQTLNIDAAKNILGYCPIYSIKEGMDEYQ